MRMLCRSCARGPERGGVGFERTALLSQARQAIAARPVDATSWQPVDARPLLGIGLSQLPALRQDTVLQMVLMR